MNKRGQIYLVAAIIVCMIAFVLVAKSNYIREQVLLQNFKDISSNYLTESPKVVNNAIGESGGATQEEKLNEIKTQLSGFTNTFVKDYARNQDPNVGLIYIYNDENGMIVQNYLNEETVTFRGAQPEGEILLDYNQEVNGEISFEDTGIETAIGTTLCDTTDFAYYCIIQRTGSTEGKYTLKIGDIDYIFNINPDSPELIVILKSQDQSTIKVDISENKL